MLRLFIAINMWTEIKRRLEAALAPLRDAGLPIRWTEPDSYHLTLKFIGDVAETDVEGISEVMRTVVTQYQPFTMSLDGFGVFPSLRRPRIVWAGLSAGPGLYSLREELEQRLAALGIPVEERPFHPHCTLGRVRGKERARLGGQLDKLLGSLSCQGQMVARTVDVMSSHLSPAGPRYESIVSVPLVGTGDDSAEGVTDV